MGTLAVFHHAQPRGAEAGAAYQTDGATAEENTIVCSVDMQKVINNVPGVKMACFTKRMIAFHETFAPINAYKRKHKTISCVWHEAVAGRKAEEITSTWLEALRKDRDFKTIIDYADKTAQNKNWSLPSALISWISSDMVSADTITVKFLEYGRTYISVDTRHAEVEKSMRSKRNIYDYEDFCDCITSETVEIVKTDSKNILNRLYSLNQI